MKTSLLAMFLCLASAFTVSPLSAQDDKVFEIIVPVKIHLECTGDWLSGQVTYVEKMTKQGFFIEKVRDATLTGFTDENLSILSGKVYELSQTATSSSDYSKGENLARITVDGKMVAVYHFMWHTTMNANGDVTADFVREWWDCK